MKKIFYTLFLLTGFQIAQSQEFVSIESLGSLSANQITSTVFNGLATAQYGVDMYKVLYTTLDA